jgi:hypothetical protein
MERGPPAIGDERRRLLGGTALGYSAELESFGLKSGTPYGELLLGIPDHDAEQLAQV